MATKSVIDIEVNDTEFRRFAAMFAQYQTSLKNTPNVWKQAAVGAAQTATAAQTVANATQTAAVAGNQTAAAAVRTATATQQTTTALQAGATAATQTAVAATRTATAASQILVITRTGSHTASSQAASWRSMAHNARSFAGSIFDATRSLLRWAGLTGIVSGLLGAGGLFGISRLAGGAGESRRSSLGLGVSIGEQKAFETNFGRVVDPNRFLSGVNEAQHDITKRVSLLSAGLSPGDIDGKNTAEVAGALLPALKRIADQTPDAVMAQTLQARRLDQFITLEDFQRLKHTSSDELAKYGASYGRDRQTLNVADPQAKAWQDLQVQLHRAGETIDTVFIKGLLPLAPQIEKLSAAFATAIGDLLASPRVKEWIDKLAEGVKWLGEYLVSDKFKEGVSDFGKKIDELQTKSAAFVDKIGDITGGVNTAIEAFKALGTGILEVSDVLARILHFTLDPLLKGRDLTHDEAIEYNKTHPDKQIEVPPEAPYAHKSWLWEQIKKPFMGQDAPGDAPRGIRNNNPLNLEFRPGQGANGSDGRFGVYRSMEEGVAADTRQLLTYQDRDHLDTIEKIINKWAPPSDHNDTAGYIADVSRRTGFKSDQQIDLHDPKTAAALVAAMARRETGQDVDQGALNRGVAMGLAGGPRNPAMPLDPSGRRVDININNNTGGSAIVTANQLAH